MKRRDSIKGIAAVTGAVAGNLFLPGLSGAQPASAAHPDTTNLPRGGINLAGLNYYNTSLPLNQVANIGNQWVSSTNAKVRPWNDGREIPLTEDGYPASLHPDQTAKTLVFTHNKEHYPVGTYRLEWDGDGELTLGGSSFVEGGEDWSNWRVSTTGANGLQLYIEKTNPQNPVRNIKLWTPEYLETGSYFRQGYLNDLKNYGVLRFMDMNGTNNSGLIRWYDRVKLTDAHWGHRGIPIEIMIDLCNAANKDFYFTCGHLVDDDYIQKLGELVKERLKPDLKFWFAYSNECWNNSFSQTRHVNEVLTPNYGYNLQKQRGRAYGRRSAECAIILRETLGSQMIHVIEGWAVVPQWAEQALAGCVEAGANPDAGAITSYFSVRQTIEEIYKDYINGSFSADRVFDDAVNDIHRVSQSWAANKLIFDTHNCPMIAYEGGTHIMGQSGGYSAEMVNFLNALDIPTERENGSKLGMTTDGGFTAELIPLNEHPRMGELIALMFEKWNQVGGQTLCYYNDVGAWSQYGSWGLKEHYEQTSTVKFDAVQQYLTSA